MTGPVELCADQCSVDAFHLCLFQDFSVWYSVLPFDPEQGPEASQVERVQLLGVPTVDGPGFACI